MADVIITPYFKVRTSVLMSYREQFITETCNSTFCSVLSTDPAFSSIRTLWSN